MKAKTIGILIVFGLLLFMALPLLIRMGIIIVAALAIFFMPKAKDFVMKWLSKIGEKQ